MNCWVDGQGDGAKEVFHAAGGSRLRFVDTKGFWNPENFWDVTDGVVDTLPAITGEQFALEDSYLCFDNTIVSNTVTHWSAGKVATPVTFSGTGNALVLTNDAFITAITGGVAVAKVELADAGAMLDSNADFIANDEIVCGFAGGTVKKSGETGAFTYSIVTSVKISLPAGLGVCSYVVSNLTTEAAIGRNKPGTVFGGNDYSLPIGAHVAIYCVPSKGYGVVGTNPYDIPEVTADTTVDTTKLPTVARGIEYIDENGQLQTNYTYEVVTTATTEFTSGWYAVKEDVEITDANITVDGAAHLILCDGATLTVTNVPNYYAAIDVSVVGCVTNSLSIYGQTAGTGGLNAFGAYEVAGIGGGYGSAGGMVTINGGTVTATGGEYAAGIGGGDNGAGGDVTINGGIVEAWGGEYAAGIGGGYGVAGGTVTINDGKVMATGGEEAAGIGGGSQGDGGIVTISGGTVTAVGGENGAGIGRGEYGDDDGTVDLADGVHIVLGGMGIAYERVKVTDEDVCEVRFPVVTGLSVRATVEDLQYVVSQTADGSNVVTVVKGEELTLTYSPVAKSVRMTGNPIITTGPVLSDIVLSADVLPGAEGLCHVHYQNWTGSGFVDAECDAAVLSDEDDALFDGCWYAVTEDVEITGHNITVDGAAHLILCDGATLTVTNVPNYYAAIDVSVVESVTNSLSIYGQTAGTGGLSVFGGWGGAGIGGGYEGEGGTVMINGGTVTATGGDYVAGIGSGYRGSIEAVTISGGIVTATGGYGAAGIGGGEGGAGSAVTINGGTVTATGGDYAAGIGGAGGAGGTVTINGGSVTATGGDWAAGIGNIEGCEMGAVVFGADFVGGVFTEDGGMMPEEYAADHRARFVTMPVAVVSIPQVNGLIYTVSNGTEEVTGVFRDGVNTYAAATGDTLRVYFTLKPGCTYVTEPTNPKPVSVSDWFTTVDVTDLPQVIVPEVEYLDWDGEKMVTNSVTDYTFVTAEMSALEAGQAYVVAGEVIRQGCMVVNGTPDAPTYLILCDNAKMMVMGMSEGIAALRVAVGGEVTNALVICGQTVGNGELAVTNLVDYGAGIGGNDVGYGTDTSDCGVVTINGGIVTVTGGSGGAGIGGGWDGAGGIVTINGGVVTAMSFDYGGAGIGGGHGGAGGTVTINGGTVTATGGDYAAGIGGGYYHQATGGTVTINGGTVTALGGECGAGIGGGDLSAGGIVTINGGTVIATGGNGYGDGTVGAAGIGGGYGGDGGTVVITGGKVTAHGKDGGEDIGHGDDSDDSGTVTISGGLFWKKPENRWTIAEGCKAVLNVNEESKADYPWAVAPLWVGGHEITKEQIGVCSWTWHGSISNVLEQMKADGRYNGIQLALAPWLGIDSETLYFGDQEGPEVWEFIKEKIGEGKLNVMSTMINFPGEDYTTLASITNTQGYMYGVREHGSASDASVEHWKSNLYYTAEAARLTAELGVKTLTTESGFICIDEDLMFQRVSEVCATCLVYGVDFLIESGPQHSQFMTNLLTRLNAAGFHNVGVNFDPGDTALFGPEDPVASFNAMKPWIRMIHAKDCEQDRSAWNEDCVWGDGYVSKDLDFGAGTFLTTVNELGYTGDILYERLSGSETLTPERAAEIKAAMDRIFGELGLWNTTPLAPGFSSDPFDSEAEAQAAIDSGAITFAPAPVVEAVLKDSTVLTVEGYKAMFAPVIYPSGDQYRVMYDLSADGTNDLNQSIHAVVTNIDLAAITAASESVAEMSLKGGLPGFYYTLFTSAAVTDVTMSESRDAANSDVLCDKTGTVTFKNVKKPSDAAGFFTVTASPETPFTEKGLGE